MYFSLFSSVFFFKISNTFAFSCVVGLLAKDDMSITEDVADALAALSNNRYITTAQKNATLRALFKKSQDANVPGSIKEHTQDLLSQLDFDDETLQMILKALLNQDVSLACLYL